MPYSPMCCSATPHHKACTGDGPLLWQVYLPSHDKQLPHHTAALSDVLLHQLTTRDSDEGAVCVMRHRSGQKGFACSWGAIQKHSLQGSVQASAHLHKQILTPLTAAGSNAAQAEGC